MSRRMGGRYLLGALLQSKTLFMLFRSISQRLCSVEREREELFFCNPVFEVLK